MMNDNRFTFEIKQHIGVLAEYPTGWCKEINIVEWNGNGCKYDIRDWSKDHEHMSRGITLREEEMSKLISFMTQNKLDLHSFSDSDAKSMLDLLENDSHKQE